MIDSKLAEWICTARKRKNKTKVLAWYAKTTPGSNIGKQSTVNISAYRFRFGPALHITKRIKMKRIAVIHSGIKSELAELIFSGVLSEIKRKITDIEELKDKFGGKRIPAIWY